MGPKDGGEETPTAAKGREMDETKSFPVMLNVYLNACLFSCCFFMAESGFPFMAKELGADVVTLGYLQTAMSFILLCGGPLYGRFGDVFGSRAALTLAYSAAALGYAILGVATSVPMLFLSRIPLGFMHTMQGLQMVITDVSDKEGRADALGKLGLCFSIGIMVGPLAGGMLSQRLGGHVVAFGASSLSLFSVIMVQLFLPKKTKILKKKEASSSEASTSTSGISKVLELLSIPTVLYLMVVRCIAVFPATLIQSMGPVISMEYFKLDPQQNGLLLTLIGTASAVVQGFGIGALLKRYSESSLLILSVCISAFAFGLMYFVQDAFWYFVTNVPLVAGFAILGTISTSMMTKAVSDEDTGVVLGLCVTCESLMRTVTPPLGTFMYLYYGWPSFGAVGFAINVGMAVILLVQRK